MKNMEKDEKLEDVVSVFKESMTEFHHAMQLREEFSVRVGRRTTQIIRFSLVGLSILGVAIFALIFTLLFRMAQITTGMDKMGEYMQDMKKNFVKVNENMDTMNSTMSSMNKHVSVMVDMNTAIGDMNGSMRQMSVNMKEMNQNMASMQTSMSQMSYDMGNMSYQFTNLNGSVGSMGYNVNRMAAPMKVFPFP